MVHVVIGEGNFTMLDRHPGHDLELSGRVGLLHSEQLETLEKVALARSIEARMARIAQGASLGRGTYWESDSRRSTRTSGCGSPPEGPGEVEYECRKIRGEDDPDAYWVVERWVEQWKCWALVLEITDYSSGKPRRVEISEYWVNRLRAADMQAAANSREYVNEKRKNAEKIQESNKKAADEVTLAAVDSLSTESLRNMVAVETAIQTGEAIRASGPDAQFLNRVYDTQQKQGPAQIPTGQSVNPGMNPKRRQRTKRGK